MAGRAVLEPEVLVEVEEAIGKRKGRLRRGGGDLQPVAPARLRDRPAGGENGGGVSLAFPGALGAWWRILSAESAPRLCVLRLSVCVRMSGCVSV